MKVLFVVVACLSLVGGVQGSYAKGMLRPESVGWRELGGVVQPFVPEEVEGWESYSQEEQEEIEEFYYQISELFVYAEDGKSGQKEHRNLEEESAKVSLTSGLDLSSKDESKPEEKKESQKDVEKPKEQSQKSTAEESKDEAAKPKTEKPVTPKTDKSNEVTEEKPKEKSVEKAKSEPKEKTQEKPKSEPSKQKPAPKAEIAESSSSMKLESPKEKAQPK